jgi:tetratricopeptide (TPR) repeat protein
LWIADCGLDTRPLRSTNIEALNPKSEIRNPQFLRGIVVAFLFSFTVTVAHADSLSLRPAPRWVAAAAARGRAAVVQRLSTPSIVAGVRGAAFRPDELYWMGAGADPVKLVLDAERAEEAGRSEEALSLYRRALAIGASGRTAARASIGAGVMLLKAGRYAEAAGRLGIAASRAGDADLRFAATMPLATALAAEGRREDGIALLKELVAKHPDHPLAGQAEGLAFMLEEN